MNHNFNLTVCIKKEQNQSQRSKKNFRAARKTVKHQPDLR